MADESFELEDGEVVASVMNGRPPSTLSAADVELRAQLDEAATALRHGGQPDLARLALGLADANLGDAMWVLHDQVRGGAGAGDFSAGDPALFDAFRHIIRGRLLSLQENGYDEHVISEAFPAMVLEAAQYAALRLVLMTDHHNIDVTSSSQQQQAYHNGGFGAVQASAAAVRSLEKLTFRAAAGGSDDDDDDDGFTECSICSEEFVDGGLVTVMPCPSRVHKFHPDCISKWLTISNMCPLCRHQLPAYYE